MSKAEKRIAVLMLEDTHGGIDGYYVLQFLKGKIYVINVSLVKAFLDMNVCAITEIPESGAYHLHLANGGRAEWRLVPKTEEV